MERINVKAARGFSLRLLGVLVLLAAGVMKMSAYKQTYNVNVGETFTVYTTYKSNTTAVLWTYDYKVVQPVTSIYSTTTSVTFKAVAASPSVGSIIQAVTYYQQRGTTSSGTNKSVDDWKVVVKDNSKVTLNRSSMSLTPGGYQTLNATASNTSYSGSYSWSSSNTNAAYVSGSGSSVRVYAKNPGSATITVKLDNGNSASCYVTVEKVDVSSASISPSFRYLDIDESYSLTLDVYPSNASVTSTRWESRNSNIVYVNSSGRVTGVSEGQTEVYCVVNGSVTSSSCNIVVTKPSFVLNSTVPSANNATEQSVFTQPSLTYCRQIYQGSAFSDITMKDGKGNKVNGTVSISGSKLTFVPTVPLEPQTTYTLFVPASAVKDKYGSTNSEVTRTFKTGNLQKLTLQVSTTEKFVEKEEKITLTSSGSNVSIYYTLDGSTPTNKSTKYDNGITISHDIKLRAFAMGAGYESSDILAQDYYITNVNVIKKFPSTEGMYTYQDVNPYITFSNGIDVSTNVEGVKLKKNGKEEVEGEIVVADSSIFFVPKQPLDLGCSYQMTIPEDAVKTWQGESNHATSWTFTTGDFATMIALGGPELAAAVKTDGTLLTWGKRYQSGNSADGSYSMISKVSPSSFINDSNARLLSSGYMHHALIKNDNTLWMWGRQYCGEFGNNSTAGAANPIKVMDDVAFVSAGGQSTAIIKTDGTLWMCGRNDFGQIGDNSIITRKSPVKIMDDVIYADAGWCVTYAIKKDGSLWAWGRNDNSLLGNGKKDDSWTPVKIMDDVAAVDASATQSQWVAAIKKNGSLWVWGSKQPTPQKMLDDVCSVAVGSDYVEAVKTDGTLWAFGNNSFGQLGDGTTTEASTPRKVMDNVAIVASGGQTTIANMLDGSVWTWGRNNGGILGNNMESSSVTYNATPSMVVEGRSSAALKGVAARKREFWIAEGSTNVINALPTPLNAIYSDIKWYSKNDKVANVTERGVITAKSIGETDVTATIRNHSGNEYVQTYHIIVASPTSIENIEEEPSSTSEPVIEIARYNMNGQLIQSPQKGVNIIRYSDGTTKKVYVK